jgi:hypothetical protein
MKKTLAVLLVLTAQSFAYVHYVSQTLKPTVQVLGYAGRGVVYVAKDSGKAVKKVAKVAEKTAVVVAKEVF